MVLRARITHVITQVVALPHKMAVFEHLARTFRNRGQGAEERRDAGGGGG